MNKPSMVREFEWKLHNFTKKSINSRGDSYIDSDEFTILLEGNETKWKFSANVKNSVLSIFLRLQQYDFEEFSINFSLWIQNKQNLVRFRRLNADDPKDYLTGCGFGNLIKVDDIFNDSENFLQNDEFTLRAKIELSKKPAEQKMGTQNCESNKLLLDLRSKFSELFVSKFNSDFKFICSDGMEIPAHSIVLATNSSVFRSMLDTPMTESKDRVAKLDDIDGETMTEILRFMYTREVLNIDSLAHKLLYGAEKYELEILKEICTVHMIKNLNIDNAIDYFVIAERYDLKDLLSHSMSFIDINYQKFRQHKDWAKIDYDLAVLLMDYKDSKRVHVLDSLIKDNN